MLPLAPLEQGNKGLWWQLGGSQKDCRDSLMLYMRLDRLRLVEWPCFGVLFLR